MKIINFIIVSILFFCLCSCKENIERKVYFNFTIGSSINKTQKVYQDFRRKNKLTKCSNYPYYKHQFQGNNNYYSSPLYESSLNDTIVHTLKIFYTLNPQDLDNVLNQTKEGYLSMQSCDYNSYVKPIMVYKDISKELEAKYGKYTSVDTVRLDLNQTAVFKHWEDKDGLNIGLCYTFVYDEFSKSTTFYNLSLEFTFTDEIKRTLIKDNSIY